MTLTRCRLADLTGEMLSGWKVDLSGSTLTGWLEVRGAEIAGQLICGGAKLNGEDNDSYALVGDLTRSARLCSSTTSSPRPGRSGSRRYVSAGGLGLARQHWLKPACTERGRGKMRGTDSVEPSNEFDRRGCRICLAMPVQHAIR
jgi:hypothetical protein